MNDIEKLISIMDGGAQSPALDFGLSALIFAHDDECPKLSDVTKVCNCDPDIYDGLTNQKIEPGRPAPAGSNDDTGSTSL